MTDEQKILLALVKLMFPREMLDYFEVVGFELHEDSISVRLDERDRILKKKSGHTYVKNGFLPESRITRFCKFMCLLVKTEFDIFHKGLNFFMSRHKHHFSFVICL